MGIYTFSIFFFPIKNSAVTNILISLFFVRLIFIASWLGNNFNWNFFFSIV